MPSATYTTSCYNRSSTQRHRSSRSTLTTLGGNGPTSSKIGLVGNGYSNPWPYNTMIGNCILRHGQMSCSRIGCSPLQSRVLFCSDLTSNSPTTSITCKKQKSHERAVCVNYVGRGWCKVEQRIADHNVGNDHCVGHIHWSQEERLYQNLSSFISHHSAVNHIEHGLA